MVDVQGGTNSGNKVETIVGYSVIWWYLGVSGGTLGGLWGVSGGASGVLRGISGGVLGGLWGIQGWGREDPP